MHLSPKLWLLVILAVAGLGCAASSAPLPAVDQVSTTAAREEPKDWNINGDAPFTAVVANQGKVLATFGYQSVNETDVPRVRETLEKSLQRK